NPQQNVCAANTSPRCPRFPESFRAQEGPIAPRRAPQPGSLAMPRDLKMEHVREASGHHKAPGTTEEPLKESVQIDDPGQQLEQAAVWA
ncbi:unnamed protein product, partial [Rangifer tarandus platyrhynchus]